MIVIPPITISALNLTSTTVADPNAPAAYAGGTTYGNGALVYDTTTKITYQSLQAANVGNTPALSPLWWDAYGLYEVAYSSGTTYALGDYATYNHRIYQSLVASNTAHQPFISPVQWLDIGPTNQYAMFDTLRNTATVAASPLTVVITPGVRIDSVAALNVIADGIEVILYASDGVTVVYDKTVDLTTRTAFTWFDYFFAPFKFSDAYLFGDVPPYFNGIIHVIFTRGAGNVTVGALCSGLAVELGAAQYGAIDDAQNYSTVARDAFGNAVLIPRRSVPKTTQTVWAPSAQVGALRDVRTLLNAVPAVWSGLDDNDADYFRSLLILGIYNQFTINLSYQNIAEVTLELQEI